MPALTTLRKQKATLDPSSAPGGRAPRDRRPLGRRRPAAAAVAVGLVLAALSMLGDTPGTLRVLSLVGNLASPWLLGALLVGWLAHRAGAGVGRSAVAGTATLLVASAGYYLAWAGLGYSPNANTALWVVVALLIGPIAGWAGATLASRIGGWRHLGAAVLPAAMVLAEIAWVAQDRGAWRWDLVDEPHRAIDLAVLVGLAAIGAVLAWRAGRDRRPVVLGLVAVAATVGVLAFDVLMRTAATI